MALSLGLTPTRQRDRSSPSPTGKLTTSRRRWRGWLRSVRRSARRSLTWGAAHGWPASPILLAMRLASFRRDRRAEPKGKLAPIENMDRSALAVRFAICYTSLWKDKRRYFSKRVGAMLPQQAVFRGVAQVASAQRSGR